MHFFKSFCFLDCPFFSMRSRRLDGMCHTLLPTSKSPNFLCTAQSLGVLILLPSSQHVLFAWILLSIFRYFSSYLTVWRDCTPHSLPLWSSVKMPNGQNWDFPARVVTCLHMQGHFTNGRLLDACIVSYQSFHLCSRSAKRAALLKGGFVLITFSR